MGFAYRYDEKTNVLVLRYWGELTLDEEIEAIQSSLEEIKPRTRPGIRVLSDRTRATVQVKPDQMQKVIQASAGAATTLNTPKTAIVVSSQLDYGMFRMFDLMSAEQLQHDFGLFKDMAEACAWLGIDPEAIQWPKGPDG